MRMSKANAFWLGVIAVAFACYAWAGAVYDPLLGKLRSGVADTLQMTAGESVTVSAGGSIATNRGGNYRAEGAGGAADNLDIITGGQTGDVLFLRAATAGHTITLRNNVAGGGNIVTQGAVDYAIPDNGFVQLYFRGESWLASCPAVAGVGGIGDVTASGTLTANYVMLGNGTKVIKAATTPATMESSLTIDQPGTDVSSPILTLSGDLIGSDLKSTFQTSTAGLNIAVPDVLGALRKGLTVSSDTITFGDGGPSSGGADERAIVFDGYLATDGRLVYHGWPVLYGASYFSMNQSLTVETSLTVGATGKSGSFSLYSEQGATDYTGTQTETALTSNRTYYWPDATGEVLVGSTATSERGDVLYYGAAGWAKLNHGTSGQALKSGGHAADPSWGDVSEVDTLATVTARGETATADLILPASGALKIAGTGANYKLAWAIPSTNSCFFGDSGKAGATGAGNFGALGALTQVTDGANNIGIGGGAVLYTLSHANGNIAIGASSLVSAYGDYNVAIGYAAGVALADGGTNTFLGYRSGYSGSQSASAHNSTAVGANSYTDADNQIVLGDSAVTQVKTSGDLLLSTGRTVKVNSVDALKGPKELWIGAGAWVPNTTSGPTAGTLEVGTAKVMADGYWFDPATNQTAQWSMVMPSNWDCGPVKVKTVYYSASANESGVCWEDSGMAVTDGTALDTAFGESVQVVDTHRGAGKVSITAASAAMTFAGTPGIGYVLYGRTVRNAATAADTFNESAFALGNVIQYTESPVAAFAW